MSILRPAPYWWPLHHHFAFELFLEALGQPIIGFAKARKFCVAAFSRNFQAVEK